jgi:hypothetical protein
VKNSNWKNRIVGQAAVDPKSLIGNPDNWRIHPHSQEQAVSGILEEVGWVKQILVNKRTGRVVDGHLRLKLALQKQEAKVPVLYVDLTEDEESLILLTLDPMSELAVSDSEKLDALMRQVEVENDSVLDFIQDMSLDGLMPGEASEEGSDSEGGRNLGQPRYQINPVLYADQIEVFEEALALTDNMNRGEALLEVCQFYVDHKKAKGQLDAKAKGRAKDQAAVIH